MTQAPFPPGAPAQPGTQPGDQPGGVPGAPGYPPPPGYLPYTARPPLRRSRADRVVAGVCGGIGRSLGVDPLLFRVLVVVFSVVGGAGLIAYLVAWLIIPDDGAPTSEGRRLYDEIRREPSSSRSIVTVLLVVLLAVVALPVAASIAFGGPGWLGNGAPPLLLLAAAAALIALWALRRDDRPNPLPPVPGPHEGLTPNPTGAFMSTTETAATGTQPRGAAGADPVPDDPRTNTVDDATATVAPAPETGGDGSVTAGTSAPEPQDASPTSTYPTAEYPTGAYPTGTYPTAAYPTAAYPTAAYPTAGYATGYAYGGTGGYGYGTPGPTATAPVPVAPTPRRRRSPLGLLTLSVAVLLVGVLAAVDVAGGTVPGVVYVAAPLTVLGLGLLVGAVAGHAKWLLWLAVPLAIVTAAVAVVPDAVRTTAGAGVGDPVWRPTSVAAVSSEYRLAAGDATLDLRQLPLTGGGDARTITTAAQVGTGRLVVVLPATATVRLAARVGVGELRLPGAPARSGLSIEENTVLAPAGTSSGTVDLTLEVGAGSLEVRRATA